MRPDWFEKYLALLGVEPAPPSLDALSALVEAQLTRVPFENLSKMFLRRRDGADTLPSLDEYLDGIERFHLGGTCYPNNGYFNQLLRFLDYDVKLCGADMDQPDVHLVNVVRVDGRQVLVDVGYAAPFFEPLPLDLPEEHVVTWGADRYVLEPRDPVGRVRLRHEHRGRQIHGYVVKPHARSISFFEPAIRSSYRDEATFMSAIVLVRFWRDHSVRIHNLELVESTPWETRITALSGRDELVGAIKTHFGIPGAIVRGVIAGLGPLRPVHDVH